MKPRDIEVYEALPELVATLNSVAVQAFAAFRQLPLAEMRAANGRARLTGTYTRRGTTTAMPADAAKWTEQLIDAAEAYVKTLARLTGETPPDTPIKG